jgi:hypothetical protein
MDAHGTTAAPNCSACSLIGRQQRMCMSAVGTRGPRLHTLLSMSRGRRDPRAAHLANTRRPPVVAGVNSSALGHRAGGFVSGNGHAQTSSMRARASFRAGSRFFRCHRAQPRHDGRLEVDRRHCGSMDWQQHLTYGQGASTNRAGLLQRYDPEGPMLLHA